MIGMHRDRIEIRTGIAFETAHEHIPVRHESFESGFADDTEIELIHFPDFAAQKLARRRAVRRIGAQKREIEFRSGSAAQLAPFGGETFVFW